MGEIANDSCAHDDTAKFTPPRIFAKSMRVYICQNPKEVNEFPRAIYM